MKRNILIWSSEPKSNSDNSQMPWDQLNYKISEFSVSFAEKGTKEKSRRETKFEAGIGKV